MENLHLQRDEAPDLHSSSSDYAGRFSGTVGDWFLAVQEQIVCSLLGNGLGRTLLDVGGGHGQIAPAAVKSGYSVTVLGSTEVYAERLKALIEADSCAFKVGNMLSLPFADSEFDVVTCFRQVAHVHDWQTFVHELCRVARDMVIIDYATQRSVNAFAPLFFKVKKGIEGNTRSFSVLRDSDLLAVFEQSGFTVAERVAQYFIPMSVHRVLKSPRLSATLENICSRLKLVQLFGSPVILKMVRQRI